MPKLLYPVSEPRIVQPFGVNWTGVPNFYTRFGLPAHEGVDFYAPVGTPVFASHEGRVRLAGMRRPDDPYGYQVRIRFAEDGEQYEIIFAHLSVLHVKTGDIVSEGQLIGLAGSTGNSKGAHLHVTLKHLDTQVFTYGKLRYPNGIIDPTPYFYSKE